MKKLMLSLGACSLAFAAPVSVPTAASAAPATGLQDACRAFIEANPGIYKNLGECMSDLARFCNELKKADLLDDFGFKNQGDCVNQLKDFFN